MNISDIQRNSYQLCGPLAKKGYMRWWHSFSGLEPASGDVRTFFVEFFVINPKLSHDIPIYGQHPYYKKNGIKPSYVMVKAGVLPGANGEPGKQLHAFYPISALRATGSPLLMEVEDCFYSEDHISGCVEVSSAEAQKRYLMTDAGVMVWDLEVHKSVACHTGLCSSLLAQFCNVLDSYWHGEGIRSFFRGTVLLDGIKYIVSPELSYGYADKHWGRNFNNPWFQFTGSKLQSERTGKELRHSVLAINGCIPRFFKFPLRRRLMLQLTYTGEDFSFMNCRWETKETNKRYIWHIIAKNKTAIIKISGSCLKSQMMNMNYENPDGRRSKLPLWIGSAGVGTIKIYRRTPQGRELLDTLTINNALCEYRAEL